MGVKKMAGVLSTVEDQKTALNTIALKSTEDLWIQSPSSSTCGHRQDRKGNEKLNALLIEIIFGDSHQVQDCCSGLRMDHLDDNLYPPVALFLVKLHCYVLGYWMLTMQGKYSKNDEFGGKGNITAAFFWLGSSLHGQRIK
ncbi:hypothetical protein ACROYT_G027360 [Oculina patagonica]